MEVSSGEDVATPVDGFLMIGPRGDIREINSALPDMVGYSRDELLSMNIRDLATECTLEDIGQHREWVMREGRCRFETKHPRKNGQILSFEMTATCIELDGQLQFVAFVRPITEHERAQEEIRKRNEELGRRDAERTAQLEAAIEELESFSYSVSHDLRGPLRAIDGYSRVLLEDHSAALDGGAKRLLNIIRRNTTDMARLIDDLLTFSRLGRKALEESNINMSALAHSVVEEWKKAQPERSVDVAIEELPPARGDGTMIPQLFQNFISNAFKFTRYRPDARIHIGSYVTASETVYYIKDNGAGFDMLHVRRLFRVFQRLHSVEQFEGTGVGLAIVKRIVEKHGGRVWAEGKVNEGATFYFTLPGARPQRHGSG